jgi:pimeloyl-ACP methyl ester carboxylesterase
MVTASRVDALAQSVPPSRLANWPAPRVNGFKVIGDVNIYYEEQGPGVPVVLCRGGRLNAESTRPTVAKLAAKYRVISWDRPNTGRSEVSFKGSKDVDMWADQMMELLGALNAVPAYLVGPSMGVRTNFATAVQYPMLCGASLSTSPAATISGRIRQKGTGRITPMSPTKEE